MARIRTVKPELFRHEALFELEQETGLPVRLAFIGLFTCCDREGRFKWRPRALQLDVMPYDNHDFSRVLDALTTRGFLMKYACGTDVYGCIPSFPTHQVINNREKGSDLPGPYDEGAQVLDSTGDNDASTTRAPRVEHASPTPLSSAQGEGKGREGKGKEWKGTDMSSHAGPTCVFDHWVKVMGKNAQTLFTKDRKAKVRARLKEGYTVEQLCQAIDGCSRTPHNMGQNDQGQLYNDLELICRSGSQVDRFMQNANRVSPQERREVQLDAWLNDSPPDNVYEGEYEYAAHG